MKRNSVLLFILLMLFGYACQKNEKKAQIIDKDAAWCWFSDPRAICLQQPGQSKVIAGGVSRDGSIVAFSYDTKDKKVERGVIYAHLESDDHDNPSFLELPDGHILSFYTRHHNKDLFMSESVAPGDITKWEEPRSINISDKEEEKLYGGPRYTYANPFMLSAEKNRIYLFGRWMGFKPVMIWSDDLGKTWSNSRVVICPQPFDPGNRPYVKYYSDEHKRIHLTFTDGHPRKEPSNSVYYAYYENGGFYRADGTMICATDSLPFEPKEATLVYQGNPEQGRAWVYDIKTDENGYPVIAYARYPTEKDHIYHYARYNGKSWTDDELCNSGKWFPQTLEGQHEREPHYSGGMSIDGNNVGTIFLSREVNGVFEIEKWMMNRNGDWEHQPVTSGSQLDQVRPVVPWRGSKETPVIFWMENEKYVHYTDFASRIKMTRE